ncbi:MAG TPA: hypothetical protein VF676_11060 [Flavobacterium sp.]|jgi:hypothetical protein
MFTKEQLAKWRSEGFIFDNFYDQVAVSRPANPEIATPKNIEDDEYNEVEIGFVRYLFKIRNANFRKSVIEYTRISGPNSNVPRERVFIAGKIFPILNIIYSGDDADATKITIKQFSSFNELRLRVGEQRYSSYNINYISVDNDKIRILLPKSAEGINYEKLLLDFLTNGSNTAHTIGGEFPDYATYKLALRDKAQPEEKWLGEDGCWLFEDRDKPTIRWINGYTYIIKFKIQGRLAPFKQIFDFYNAVDGWIFRLGHRVKWCKGAKKLVGALAGNPVYFGGLEGGSGMIANNVETLLNELNIGICDYAILKFHELIFGKYATTPLTGIRAYEWDRQFIIYEQGTVAVPYYAKASSRTIAVFQSMADRDVGYGHGTLALLAALFSVVFPAFDSFDPNGNVTDSQFRIDLPLLMLYLRIHKPTAPSFINHCNEDGTLNEEYRKIIEPYEI